MPSYGAQEHKQAFEVWCETRNMSIVAKALDCNYLTPRKWKSDKFDCRDNCPYHGWDRLQEERDAAMQARSRLIEAGDHNPVTHDLAMREAITEVGPKGENPIVMKMIRSDLDRIQHWEYLYAKTYFDLTGIALNYDTIKEDEMRAHLRSGLHVTSAEAGIRMLKVIQDQIDGLQGADRKVRSSLVGEEKRQQVTLAELRKMRTLAQNTPPHRLKSMLTVIEAEGAQPASAAS